MPDYVTRASVVYDDDDTASYTAHDVIVEDDAPRFTGLVDQFGNSIYRKSDRQPIGFRLYGVASK